MKKILTSLAIIAALPFAALTAQAQMAETPEWNGFSPELRKALEAKGDPERGEALFVACQGCHRKDASGKSSGSYPRISGQHTSVLIKQMIDIHSGLRNNPKMKPYIEDHISDPVDIADVAAYLTTLPILEEKIGRGPVKSIAEGKVIFDRDCTTCHGANGEGNAEKFYPMVAAQHYGYLMRELHFIRDGDRGNSNPDMVKVVKPFREADLEALADYMSSLPAPGKKK